jgi:2-(1,2-epoxy-1,2-dihydrophenyl)acetyl-CoA isomerase
VAYETVLYEKEDAVATITMNRPDVLNALNWKLLDELHAALTTAEADDDVRVIILTGAGRGFCSGADLSPEASEGATDPSRRVNLTPLGRFGHVAVLLRRMDKPVIAAVNGIAVGAGFGFFLGCDIRIASEQARFSAIFVRRGLHPDSGTSFHLPRIVGMSRALEMMYTGDIIGAEEADRIGLVSRVVPHEELMPTVMELAGKIAKGPPLVIELVKRVANRSMGTSDFSMAIGFETWAQSICGGSEDNKEGVRAFLEKREPVFKGR